MDSSLSSARQPRSQFAQRLAADPELAARCEAIVRAIREAAEPDIRAGELSERLTWWDLKTVINMRA